MNYEKLYKEALERAKTIHNEHRAQCADIMTKVFPELKESDDKRISREITEFLVDFNNGAYERPNENTIDSWLSWLEKQGEQKSAWSEEDEEMLKSIITCADKDFFIHKEQINWLKSLKPQNKWKPNEEQLNAFEHFVRSIGESGYASPYDNNTKLLYSLLNDLKNL